MYPIEWLLLSSSVALAKPPPHTVLFVTHVDYEVAGVHRETG